jgi:hypothetical protein
MAGNNYTKKYDLGEIDFITGRPTKYNPEYCKALVDFFMVEPYKEIDIPHYKNGEVSFIDKKLIPNKLPTIEDWMTTIGISNYQTLHNWKEAHKEFFEAYTRALSLQKYFMAQNGLNGTFNAQFTQFVLHNTSDWKIKHEEKTENNVNITLMLPPNERDTRKQIGQGEVIEITGSVIEEIKNPAE